MQTEKAKSSHFDRTRGFKNQIFPTIVTKSTTVTPSPQGDLENELFDPTQAPDELEDDLFDTSMMPDLSKSTTEPATIVPDGKFCNQKHFIKKFNI